VDKLEQYLDQVCRGIGGPRSLRQHLWQELAEHLRDAAAQHKAAGLSEEAALAQALADFGGPDELHLELAATHGQRLLSVMIDKAIDWKEKTMRAKWLWTTWAYLATAGVVVLEVLSLCFFNVYLVPKLKKIQNDGWLHTEDLPILARLNSFLNALQWIGEYFLLFVLGAAVLWGLFEWRVRSENKAFMRLAALGTAALVGAVTVFFAASALIIPFEVGIPKIRQAPSSVIENIDDVALAIRALEKARANKDWEAMQEQSNLAAQAMIQLDSWPGRSPTAEQLRSQLRSATSVLVDLQTAVKEKDEVKLNAALNKFHQEFDVIRDATKKLRK
jgi:hypothetical protein